MKIAHPLKMMSLFNTNQPSMSEKKGKTENNNLKYKINHLKLITGKLLYHCYVHKSSHVQDQRILQKTAQRLKLLAGLWVDEITIKAVGSQGAGEGAVVVAMCTSQILRAGKMVFKKEWTVYQTLMIG